MSTRAKIIAVASATAVFALFFLGPFSRFVSGDDKHSSFASGPFRSNKAKLQKPSVSELRAKSREQIDDILKRLSPRDLHSLFIELGAKDFAWALSLAERTSFPAVYKGRALFGYTQVDPHGALQWARFQASATEPSSRSHLANRFIRDWAAGLFARDPSTFVQTVHSATTDKEFSDIAHGLIHYTALTRDYKSLLDNREAVEFATNSIGPNFFLGVSSDWATERPEEYLQYVAQVPESHPLRQEMLTAAASAYASLDPAAALDWALDMKHGASNVLATTAVQTWVLMAKEPLMAVQQVKAHPKATQSEIDTALRFASARLSSSNFEQAARLTSQIVDNSIREAAIKNLAIAWKGHPKYGKYIDQMLR